MSANIGLFGFAESNVGNVPSIKNIGIENCDIRGEDNVGALVGYLRNTSSSVNNCFSSGTIKGVEHVGGLIGQM